MNLRLSTIAIGMHLHLIMKLSVIIVNYNVKYFLEQALLSVRKASEGIDCEVFVVDNNSVDDSVAMVREQFPEVQLIANTDNPGFAIANNQAIHKAQGEYILLLNPDTVVEEDTFEKTLSFMDAHPDAGGLGVKMIDGKGNFLPESKRGFPSPSVAFYKMFGLSRLFPKSQTFGRYHLGFLDKDDNHEVDVLAGAFMLLRRSVLDKIGLLDEAFFMYGEDIDLSYRIVQAGFKNYYFGNTTIIHYKGESTKKGSLNYVRVFYNAMIIFAKKHFKGDKVRAFVLLLQFAIYFRAALTLLTNIARKIYLPLLDALLIFVGMYFLKDFWANYAYDNPDYFQPVYLQFNVPLYIGIWLTTVYFSGGYDNPRSARRLVRGLAVGTVLLAAVYGFLPLEYRTSRALIVLGAVWGMFSLWGLRVLLYFFKYKNFKISETKRNNIVIVGAAEESERVMTLLHQAQVDKNFIGTISPDRDYDHAQFLGSIRQLDEVVHIYKIDEIIFCAKDIAAQQITHWMTRLGTEPDYKIVPEKSLSIIGSNSKNTAGDLYTIDIQFRIATPMSRRNKRVIDVLLCGMFIVIFPVLILFIKNKLGFVKNIFSVLFARKSWVGYAPVQTQVETQNFASLPVSVRDGVLSPIDALNIRTLNDATIRRLNFLYAKDYTVDNDLEIVWKGIKGLGN